MNDNSNNQAYLYNNNVEIYVDTKEDLSAGDFKVQSDENTTKAIDGVEVVIEDEYWSNKTINGDLYVGPEAILKVSDNVTIEGNVYVLG